MLRTNAIKMHKSSPLEGCSGSPEEVEVGQGLPLQAHVGVLPAVSARAINTHVHHLSDSHCVWLSSKSLFLISKWLQHVPIW